MPLSAAEILLLHEVDRRGSLAAAAQALGLTPSAVTQQVNRLERNLGATVMTRGARGAKLTPLGSLLSEQGDSIEVSLRRAREAADDFLGCHSRRVRVAALSSTVRPLVADALALVRLRYPDAELSVTEVDSGRGVELIESGTEIDIAVIADYGRLDVPSGTRRTHLGDEPMVLVVPDDHPAATNRESVVDLARFADADWVSGAAGTRHRTQQDDIAHQFGFSPRVPFETDSYDVAESLVAAGVAVAIMPRTAWHGLRGTAVQRIRGNPIRRLVALTSDHTTHLQLLPTLIDALQHNAIDQDMTT